MAIEFSREQLKRLLGPCVYAFLLNEEYLYVGCSKQGLLRILNGSHGSARNAIAAGASLEIYPFATRDEAVVVEARLIGQHNPRFNKQFGVKPVVPADASTMTAAEFKSIRKALGLSQAALARQLGRSRWTIVEWESGRAVIPHWVPLALKHINAMQPTPGKVAS